MPRGLATLRLPEVIGLLVVAAAADLKAGQKSEGRDGESDVAEGGEEVREAHDAGTYSRARAMAER
jgi:hypothetical protein